MARVEERIYKFWRPPFRVRVWCAANLHDGGQAVAQRDELARVVNGFGPTAESAAAQLAGEVARVPFCNAVEITDDRNGDGVLVYPDWP